jgi:hypothetical protein
MFVMNTSCSSSAVLLLIVSWQPLVCLVALPFVVCQHPFQRIEPGLPHVRDRIGTRCRARRHRGVR